MIAWMGLAIMVSTRFWLGGVIHQDLTLLSDRESNFLTHKRQGEPTAENSCGMLLAFCASVGGVRQGSSIGVPRVQSGCI